MRSDQQFLHICSSHHTLKIHLVRVGDGNGANTHDLLSCFFAWIWWNILKSTQRPSPLFFSPVGKALVVICIHVIFLFLLVTHQPHDLHDALELLLLYLWKKYGGSRDQSRFKNNNISAANWTMIKSRRQWMCERSLTVKGSLLHRELFFCHKPKSVPWWMYSSPKWTKQPPNNWERL